MHRSIIHVLLVMALLMSTLLDDRVLAQVQEPGDAVADVQLRVAVDQPVVAVGDSVTFTATLEVVGNAAAEQAFLYTELPPDFFQLVDARTSLGVLNTNPRMNSVSVDLTVLDPEVPVTITIRARTTATTPVGGAFAAFESGASTAPQDDPENNVALVQVEIRPYALYVPLFLQGSSATK